MTTLVKWAQAPTWNPLQDVQRLLEGGLRSPDAEWGPRADVYETEQALVMEFDLPGIKQSELDIRIENNLLSLKGERKPAAEPERYRRVERSYGTFQRSFSLPDFVEQSKIEAKLADGVLQLTLPRRAETRPRQIHVG